MYNKVYTIQHAASMYISSLPSYCMHYVIPYTSTLVVLRDSPLCSSGRPPPLRSLMHKYRGAKLRLCNRALLRSKVRREALLWFKENMNIHTYIVNTVLTYTCFLLPIACYRRPKHKHILGYVGTPK